jgi:proteasome lid subunit RPN8/RPN11
MLHIAAGAYREMLDACWRGLPLEACGLLGGTDLAADAEATVCYPVPNAARSAKIYDVGGLDYMKVERDADGRGIQLVGVWHSHTHTAAYPSPTDVQTASNPAWHYVLVSLADGPPVVRSYRILGGNISEEPVVLLSR